MCADNHMVSPSSPLYDDEEFFDAYMQLRKDPLNYNEMFEQPALFSLVGDEADVTGKKVLDVGCGFGDTSCRLAEMGANTVVGTDISERMIYEAKMRNIADNVLFHVLDANDILSIRNIENIGEYDIIVSSLVLHYIQDLNSLFTQINELLSRGGRLIFSIEHPIYTASIEHEPEWQCDRNGAKRGFVLNHYGRAGVRETSWLGANITKYHRSVSDIVNALIECGFEIEKMLEPSPTDEQVEKYERCTQEVHRPAYLLIAARKK